MENMKMSVEQLMYANYIKYDNLKNLTSGAFPQSNSDMVNVYIDMNSLTRSLYKFNNSTIQIENYPILTHSIINLCAHIRGYYLTRHRVGTNIFIIYSKNCPDFSKQFYTTYNAKNEAMIKSNGFITNLIDSNNELLTVLCPFIKDIYFIQDTFETGVVIYDLITKQHNGFPNILLTKDVYLYQLPTLIPETVIFRPFKKNKEDLSWRVNNLDAIGAYIKYTRNDSRYDVRDIHSSLLSLLMALTNLPERNIKAVFNIQKGLDVIRNGIENKKILNGYNTDIRPLLQDLNSTRGINSTSLEFRFKALDIVYQHSIYMNTTNAQVNTIPLVNLHDPDSVKQINNEFFGGTLDVDNL